MGIDHLGLERTRRRGRPRKRQKEEVERDLQVLGVRRWRGLVAGKNGRTLFDRPKPTVDCNANGRRRTTTRRRRRRRRSFGRSDHRREETNTLNLLYEAVESIDSGS